MVPVQRPAVPQNPRTETAEAMSQNIGLALNRGKVHSEANTENSAPLSRQSLKDNMLEVKVYNTHHGSIVSKPESLVEPALSTCGQLFQGVWGKEIKDYSKKILRSCGDEHFDLDQIQFFNLKVHRAGANYRVRHGRQLMKSQGTYRLAQFFFPILADPPPGLRLLIGEVQKRNGGKKIPLILEPKVTRGRMGYFKGAHRGSIHLFDTLSTPKSGPVNYGVMDQSTLSHEMGHHLMYYLYGKKFPSYEGHKGHDSTADSYENAITNPGAAWSEGFANAMANLDGHTYGGIHSSYELSEKWFQKDLTSRLSNEYVIDAVLSEYIKSVEKRGQMYHVVFNDAAQQRVKKIITSMEHAGRQQSFQEFVSDFIEDYPEEAGRLNPLLQEFGFSELIGR